MNSDVNNNFFLLEGFESSTSKALSCKSRLEILNVLSRGRRTVVQISKETGLSCMTVRFHLKTLMMAGLVRKSSIQRTGSAGRPSVYYELSKSLTTISFPPRQYVLLSYVAISALKDSLGESQARSVLHRIGKQLGQHLKNQLNDTFIKDDWGLEGILSEITSMLLKKVGVIAEPIKVDEKYAVLRFYNCPFEEVAKHFSSIICDGFDSGLYEGLSINLPGKTIRWRRTKEIAKGDEFCEYVLSFTNSQAAKNAKTI